MLSPALPVTPASFRPSSQVAWTAWVVFLAFVVSSLLVSARQGVFPIFAQAGRCWRHGQPLYECRPDMDRYLYAPGVATLFTLSGALPERLAGVLWRLAGVALFAGALACYLGMLGPRRYAPAALWLLILPLMGGSIHNGQSNVLLLGLMLLAMVGVHQERWWAAALALGVAGLFKVYPLFLGLLVGVAYPALLWRMGVVVAAGVLMPFALQHPFYVWDQYREWLTLLTTHDRSLWTLERAPRDLYLLTRLTGAAIPLPLYRLVQVALTLLTLGVARYGLRIHGAGPALLHRLFTLACCWMLILGPAAESTTYCFLAPALALALVQNDASAERGKLLWLVYFLLAASAISCWFPLGKHYSAVLQPLAGLTLFLERLGWALRKPRQPRPEVAPPRVLGLRLFVPKEAPPCAAKGP